MLMAENLDPQEVTIPAMPGFRRLISLPVAGRFLGPALVAFGLGLLMPAVLPAEAQDTPYVPPLADDGDDATDSPRNLIGEGATLLLRGILTEIGPDLEEIGKDMGEAMGLLAPALGDLSQLMDDVGNYELPEQLDNGDILIRRKADAPPPPALGDGLRQFLPDPDQDQNHRWRKRRRPEPHPSETQL